MKIMYLVPIVIVLFFIGCSNESNINSPIEDNLDGWEVVTRSTNEEGLQVNTIFSVSKVINGDQGGFLFTGNIFETKSGKTGCVFGSLTFLAGSFSGTKTISMSLDNKKLLGTFGPSMSFNKPASFSVLYAGVNLSNNEQSDFKFVYWAPNGMQYEIPYTYLYFDKAKGVLGILNAQIPHFSRYVFVKRSL
ncbi:MAG: hypothetical protein WAR59_11000 [Ignavibacteriaceae bacterium]